MKKLLLIVGIFSLISCTKEKYPEVWTEIRDSVAERLQ